METIRTLVALLQETGLSEIEYSAGDYRVRITRKSHGAAAPKPQVEPIQTVAEVPALQKPDEPHPGDVTSRMGGVVYLAPQPGAAPFVGVGDHVREGQTLLIIEAMKVMNLIRAPRAGLIGRIFVEDAAPVEYGAPLVRIE